MRYIDLHLTMQKIRFLTYIVSFEIFHVREWEIFVLWVMTSVSLNICSYIYKSF